MVQRSLNTKFAGVGSVGKFWTFLSLKSLVYHCRLDWNPGFNRIVQVQLQTAVLKAYLHGRNTLLCAKYNNLFCPKSWNSSYKRVHTVLKLHLEQHIADKDTIWNQLSYSSSTRMGMAACKLIHGTGTLSKGEEPVTKQVTSIRPPYWLWNLVIYWKTD